jgi:hypothetical protein
MLVSGNAGATIYHSAEEWLPMRQIMSISRDYIELRRLPSHIISAVALALSGNYCIRL